MRKRQQQHRQRRGQDEQQFGAQAAIGPSEKHRDAFVGGDRHIRSAGRDLDLGKAGVFEDGLQRRGRVAEIIMRREMKTRLKKAR